MTNILNAPRKGTKTSMLAGTAVIAMLAGLTPAAFAQD
jgi:hypothetical protein